MRSGRLGGLLLATGAAVGVAAVVGLVVGFEPARLPPALINIAVYKLTVAAAAGLLGGGAIVRRYDKRTREGVPARATRQEQGNTASLPAGDPEAGLASRRSPKEEVPVLRKPR